MQHRLKSRLTLFASKFKGNGTPPEGVPSPRKILLASSGAVFGIGALTLLHHVCGNSEATILVASSGSSAILLFASPTIPFAQPRNVIGGHVLGAMSGLAIHGLLSGTSMEIMMPALSVGLAVAAMHSTSTMHPPAGGTTMMAATGVPVFFLVPVLVGSVAQVGAACLWHNSFRDGRKYPQYW